MWADADVPAQLADLCERLRLLVVYTLAPMRDIIRSQPVYTISYYGKSLEYNAEQILADKYTIWCGEQLWTAFVFAAIVSLTICVVTFFVASWVLGRQETAE
jgi:hypothetical protein